ncbi:MAG: ATP-dependent helicase [Acidobacteria bacterium]|nr:MAG: ATP-dependent helicase [Acidobacteriota bacterium]PYY18264.1 MAG: ATP-dependent helicase [Acidobacteriota bacterium]
MQEQLSTNNFHTPTPVQNSAIPAALSGKDLLATAQTGTGKTLAFLLPVAERLLQTRAAGVQALVLVPTRELAIQVELQFDQLRGRKLNKAALVIGGAAERQQIAALKTAHLVIATPGRLEDFLRRKLVKLGNIQILVLDEADRMLDMGFLPAIRRIADTLPKTRQTLCFSATLDPAVAHIVSDFVQNPLRIAFGSTSKPAASVRLQAFEVATNQRLALLQRLLSGEDGRCLVFVRTKRGADRLTRQLRKAGFAAGMLHGDRSQSQRNAALADFQNGTVPILVATDVASRGIHVDAVAHVINYELPQLAEDLIHRVGRTGRIGATGTASVFVAHQDRSEFRAIERTLGLKIERMRVDGDLAIEERSGPVLVQGAPVPVMPGSKMVRLPGEVLQRYAAV